MWPTSKTPPRSHHRDRRSPRALACAGDPRGRRGGQPHIGPARAPGSSLEVAVTDLDTDLGGMSREALEAEVRRLRAGVRAHRDASGHDLCWHHPELWSLLPEPIPQAPAAVPPEAEFLDRCRRYHASLTPGAKPRAPLIVQV